MGKRETYDYFISYKFTESANEAKFLYQELVSSDKKVFIFTENPEVGNVNEKCLRAYRHSNTILLIVSPHVFEKDLIINAIQETFEINSKEKVKQLIIPICFRDGFDWKSYIPESIKKLGDEECQNVSISNINKDIQSIFLKEKEWWKKQRRNKEYLLNIIQYREKVERRNKIFAVIIIFVGFLVYFCWPDQLDITKSVDSLENAHVLVLRAIKQNYFQDSERKKYVSSLIDRLRKKENSVNTLCDSIVCGFSGVSSYLISQNSNNIFLYNDEGLSPLMIASGTGNFDIVKLIIKITGERKKECINASFSPNSTNALTLALGGEHMDIAKYLVENGADIFRKRSTPNKGTGYTLLMAVTARNGKLNIVKFLVEAARTRKSEYINTVSSDNMSALICALGTGQIEVAEYLVENGADIFKTYSIQNKGTGFTSLMIISQHGNMEAVKFLIEVAGVRKKEYINAISSDNTTALSAALATGQLQIAKYLVENGADIFQKFTDSNTGKGYTLLMLAVSSGKLDIVKFLIKEAGVRKKEYINMMNFKDGNSLNMAIGKGYAEILKYLIENGADIFGNYSIKNKGDNFTSLMFAANEGHLEIVKYLIEASGERKKEYINALSSDNSTALSISLAMNHTKVADFLIDNGADIEKKYTLPNGITGTTLLMVEAQEGKLDAVKYLIEASGERKKEYINATNSNEISALTLALGAGYWDVARYLIENGADIFKTFGSLKNTLLDEAAVTNRANIALFLINEAKDRKYEMINHVDLSGQTAIMHATKINAQKIVQILLDEGADLNFINASGQSVLDISENPQIRRILVEAGAKSAKQLKKKSIKKL